MPTCIVLFGEILCERLVKYRDKPLLFREKELNVVELCKKVCNLTEGSFSECFVKTGPGKWRRVVTNATKARAVCELTSEILAQEKEPATLLFVT
jgi:hypothetical protein